MPAKAIVIDDDFGRPTRRDLQKAVHAMRGYLTDNPPVKAWMDAQFGLTGSNMDPDYFEPLLADGEKRIRFWRHKHESPSGEAFPTAVFAANLAEINNALAPLDALRGYLESKGIEVVCKDSVPPDADALPTDFSVIIVDYVVNKGAEGNYLEESRKFVRTYVDRVKNSDGGCPYVVLMSGLVAEARQQAPGFQQEVGLHGAYFRFHEKGPVPAGLREFQPAFEAFGRQRKELEQYRRMHESLRCQAETAAKEVISRIDQLELQDLATLHAGQLIQEGETLSDYLAWLYGQVYTAHLVRSAQLTVASGNLPIDTYEVLLGHLPATQHIFEMFSAFSLVKPATTLAHKKKAGVLPLRFGDLFEIPVKPKGWMAGQPIPTSYFMVMSQTCDLLQCKITNDQVLCAQGSGSKIARSEVDLLRATVKQMNNSGSIVLKNGGDYVQIDWQPKDVRTFDLEKLTREQDAVYLGRLNEIYALEVQHNVLTDLGRVGVPIQPGYSTFFQKVEIRVFSAKDIEVAVLAKSFDHAVFIAVLRNDKKNKAHRLLVSDEVRDWMKTTLVSLEADPALPPGLKADVTKFKGYVIATPSWSLIVKEANGGLKVQRPGAAGESEAMENKIVITMPGIFEPRDPSNVRVEIAFHPAKDFPAAAVLTEVAQ